MTQEQFEKWARENGFNPERDSCGKNYRWLDVQTLWEAVKESRRLTREEDCRAVCPEFCGNDIPFVNGKHHVAVIIDGKDYGSDHACRALSIRARMAKEVE